MRGAEWFRAGAGDGLFGEAAGGVPELGERDPVAHPAPGLAPDRVVGEVQLVAGGCQGGAVAGGVVGEGGDGAGRGGAAGAAAQCVVGVGQGAAVDHLGLDAAQLVPLEDDLGVGAGGH